LRFLDANVFIYAFYMPTRKLNADKDKKAMKDGSKRIIRRINDGIGSKRFFGGASDKKREYR